MLGFGSKQITVMRNEKYDEAFKRNAVPLVEAGQTGARVARDLGVPSTPLYAWCKRYRTTASVHGHASHNQDETTRLRTELERTKMESALIFLV